MPYSSLMTLMIVPSGVLVPDLGRELRKDLTVEWYPRLYVGLRDVPDPENHALL